MRGIRPLRQSIQHPAIYLHRPQPPRPGLYSIKSRPMSSQREDSIPHELRTAAEPRQNRLYPVRLAHVEQVNPSIRLLQFAIPKSENSDNNQQPFAFSPGQWLDVHIPSIANAGGFTITSTPADAQALPPLAADGTSEIVAAALDTQGREPYVELAVQDSPSNPPAAWLWKPKDEIIGKEVNIRVGGSFVWPPTTGIDARQVKNVVLIAGGVGINPLISILSHLSQTQSVQPLHIHFLYSTRLSEGQATGTQESAIEQILFLPRLRHIIRAHGSGSHLRISLDLFLTNSSVARFSIESPADFKIHTRRINDGDIRSAIVGQKGEIDPQGTVAYVCGPPVMTDELVERAQELLGEGGTQRVFFEKWW